MPQLWLQIRDKVQQALKQLPDTDVAKLNTTYEAKSLRESINAYLNAMQDEVDNLHKQLKNAHRRLQLETNGPNTKHLNETISKLNNEIKLKEAFLDKKARELLELPVPGADGMTLGELREQRIRVLADAMMASVEVDGLVSCLFSPFSGRC